MYAMLYAATGYHGQGPKRHVFVPIGSSFDESAARQRSLLAELRISQYFQWSRNLAEGPMTSSAGLAAPSNPGSAPAGTFRGIMMPYSKGLLSPPTAAKKPTKNSLLSPTDCTYPGPQREFVSSFSPSAILLKVACSGRSHGQLSPVAVVISNSSSGLPTRTEGLFPKLGVHRPHHQATGHSRP
jgi:hypothetical protein